VDYLSTWRVPIDVRLGRAAGFTYGVVATELVEAGVGATGFADRLVNRFGSQLLRVAARSLSDLPTHDDQTPDDVLAHRLSEFMANEFNALVAPIIAAADGSTRLDAQLATGVLRLVDVYGPNGLHPVRLIRDGHTVWGHRYDTLIQRAAVEVFELHATHARLRRCIYCHSVYVPQQNERFCQWNVWPRMIRPDGRPMRLCSDARHKALQRANAPTADPLLKHTRMRKLLFAREARLRDAAIQRGEDPDDSLAVQKARKARLDYVEQAGFRRGRKARPIDPPDITRPDNRKPRPPA
jgi:hypothetical protein